jgi:hypothetical protein
MPLDMYNDFSAVAEMRGVDMSGMMNWICAEYRPMLLKKKAEHEANMLEAAATNLRESIELSGQSERALGILRDLLKQLQDMYAMMSKRALDEDARRAG